MHWIASIVASSDGWTPSATRICGVLVVLAFIVKMFVHPDLGTLGAAATLAGALFAVRDGGPIDAIVKAKVAVAAATAGVQAPSPPEMAP